MELSWAIILFRLMNLSFLENGIVEERTITRVDFRVAVNKTKSSAVRLFYSKAADYYLSTITYL